MKRFILFCFLLTSSAFASDVLDERIAVAPSVEALVDNLKSIEKGMSKEEAFAFSIAWGELMAPLRHENLGLSQAETDAIALGTFAGLTPRQVILLGHQIVILRWKLAEAHEPLEKEYTKAVVRDALSVIRRFKEVANQ